MQHVPREHRQKRGRPAQEDGEQVERNGPEHDLVAPDIDQPLLDQVHPLAALIVRRGVGADQGDADGGDGEQRRRRPIGRRRGQPDQKARQHRPQHPCALGRQGTPGQGAGQFGSRHQHGRHGAGHRKGADGAEHHGDGEDRNQRGFRMQGQKREAGVAHKLRHEADQHDGFAVIAVRRLPCEQGQGEQRQELRQPHHAHQERALIHRMGLARQGVDLPADRHRLAHHRQGREHPGDPEHAKIGMAKDAGARTERIGGGVFRDQGIGRGRKFGHGDTMAKLVLRNNRKIGVNAGKTFDAGGRRP